MCDFRQQGVDWSYSLIRLLQQLMHTEHWADIMKNYLRQSFKSMMGVNISILSHTDIYHEVQCEDLVSDFCFK